MKKAPKAPRRLLTHSQALALLAFANIAGHQWRSKLRRLWAGEGVWTGLTRNECADLRAVRNSITSQNQFANITLDHARLVILEATQPVADALPDFEIKTYKPTGSGGFGTAEGIAVRITCKVTGITIDSHRERSVHRNKEVAWRGLCAAREASMIYPKGEPHAD